MKMKPTTAVIGAGPSGLAACKVLREHGIPTTCFEAGDRVGGQWVLGNASGSSACYRSVITNTHRGMIQFSDFEPDPSYPDFPHHTQMAAYFASYAEHFELLSAIEFRTRVTSARRTPEGRWKIETDRGTGGTFDALVVASGRYGEPNWPELEGELDGQVLHSQSYMDPDDPVSCRNRDVLIIGLGNTACDLAVELSETGCARRVLLSARSGNHIIPRRWNGKLPNVPHAADPVHPALRWVPPPLRASFMRAVLPRAMRYMTRGRIKPQDVGLPVPKDAPNPTNVTANDHVLERLRDGAIEARPEVRTLRGSKVEFVDGSVDAVDIVIAATGYDISLPFFAPDLQLGVHELELYRGLMHPRHQNLYFVGLIMGLCANWPFAEQQAMWVAAHLAGHLTLPDRETIARRTGSPSSLSRDTLNCQLAAEALRSDRRRQRESGG